MQSKGRMSSFNENFQARYDLKELSSLLNIKFLFGIDIFSLPRICPTLKLFCIQTGGSPLLVDAPVAVLSDWDCGGLLLLVDRPAASSCDRGRSEGEGSLVGYTADKL